MDRSGSRCSSSAPADSRFVGRLRAAFAFGVLASVSLVARIADAHDIGLSHGEYVAAGSAVHAVYVFSGPELAAAFHRIDGDGDSVLSPSEVTEGRDALFEEIVEPTVVLAQGDPCRPRLDAAALAEGDAVVLHAEFACDAPVEELTVAWDFLDRLAPAHRHVARLQVGARSLAVTASVAHPQATVSTRASGRVRGGWVRWLGVALAAAGVFWFARRVW
jgi:hypothetical protein